MTQRALEAVIGRAILDETFRLALFADPEAALAGYELTEEELAALRMVDAESLEAFASNIRLHVISSLSIEDIPDLLEG